MERLKVLASAAALGTFTASQLAAHAGVKEATARSVLDRDRRIFRAEDVATRAAKGAKGRPPTLWRVIDLDALRDQLREKLPDLAEWQSGAGYSRTPEGRYDAAWDAVEEAEDRFMALLSTDGNDVHGLHLALRTIRATVRPLLAVPDEWKADRDPQARGTDDDLMRRALVVDRFAALQQERLDLSPAAVATSAHRFDQATRALSKIADGLPQPILSGYWMTSMRAAESMYCLPPVQIVTPPQLSAGSLFAELNHHEWTVNQDSDVPLRRWVPAWASSLAETGLVTTVLFGFENHVALSIAKMLPSLMRTTVRTVAKPLVVADHVRESDLRAASLGAYQLVARRSGIAGLVCAAHSQAPWPTISGSSELTIARLFPAALSGPRDADDIGKGWERGSFARMTRVAPYHVGSDQDIVDLARRDLADHPSASPRRSHVMLTARVAWFSSVERYGMAMTATGDEVFFDRSALPKQLSGTDLTGTVVQVRTYDGLLAQHVRVLEERESDGPDYLASTLKGISVRDGV